MQREATLVRRVERAAFGVWVATALVACASSAPRPPSTPQSAAATASQAPRGALPQRQDKQPIPEWIRALLPEVELGSAVNVMDLVAAPNIVITRKQIVVEGRTVGSVEEYAAKGHLARVDPVFDAMKNIRARYQALHPASAFPGVVMIWVDRRVPALVVKDVFQTAAFAGFPNVSFVVLDRNTSGHYARLNADALVPGPGPGNTVSGRLPPEVIQRIVREHYAVFRACYVKALARNPEATGKVVVRFVIGRDGHVAQVADNGSTLADAEAVQCVLAAYRKLVFPQPEGGIVTVLYPIMFSPE